MAIANSIVVAAVHKDLPCIPGYPTPIPLAYQIGDDGSVWSSLATGGPRQANGRRYKRLNGRAGPNGYRAISLRLETMHFQFLVHRLVLLTFVGPCPEGMESCHANGIRNDNRAVNLRWATHRENIQDKFIHGTIQRGEQIVQAKLTELDIIRIRRLVELSIPQNLVADAFCISSAQMSRIIAGSRWHHV